MCVAADIVLADTKRNFHAGDTGAVWEIANASCAEVAAGPLCELGFFEVLDSAIRPGDADTRCEGCDFGNEPYAATALVVKEEVQGVCHDTR